MEMSGDASHSLLDLSDSANLWCVIFQTALLQLAYKIYTPELFEICCLNFLASVTGCTYVQMKVVNDSRPLNSHEKLRVLTVASHLTQESCQYVLASAAHFSIDIHLLAYQDRQAISRLYILNCGWLS